jgi:cytochrome c553
LLLADSRVNEAGPDPRSGRIGLSRIEELFMKKVVLFALSTLTLALAGPALALGVGGNPAAGKAKSEECTACHTATGNSKNTKYPKIAGFSEFYIYKQLTDYKEGRRVNNLMSEQVAVLNDQDMRDLAAYFASQDRTPGTADETVVELGRAVYMGGNSATGVAACAACHAPNGAGNAAAKFPALAGQHPEYISTQLHAFSKGERANDAGQMMRNIASKMSDAEIEAVSEYVSGLQ